MSRKSSSPDHLPPGAREHFQRERVRGVTQVLCPPTQQCSYGKPTHPFMTYTRNGVTEHMSMSWIALACARVLCQYV